MGVAASCRSSVAVLSRTAGGQIVVCGMSGRLPECKNLQEYWEKLMQGIDMVTEEDGRRFEKGKYNNPPRSGKLPEVDRFDAQFFHLSPGMAHTTDPGMRILLEVAYEAIVDAGENPMQGGKIGVFIGQMCGDSAGLYLEEETSGFEAIGTARSMMANRLSHFFGFTGPSMNVDTACSSSLQAMCLAVEAMLSGRCDAAVVGGVNILLDASITSLTNKLKMLSPDGACKAFDQSANGYVRSEGVVAMFIRRKDDAKRIYGAIHDILDNCNGAHAGGITMPDGENQFALMSAVYQRSALDTACVDYVECHGTGTQAGDPQESGAICRLLCAGRTTPLLVGSVKSNIGHTEGAAGLASLAKALLAFKYRCLPPNLHFKTPNPNIPALQDGKIHVVEKVTPFQGRTVAVNSFGFGGENVHAVITDYHHPTTKQKTVARKSYIPNGQLSTKPHISTIEQLSTKHQAATSGQLSTNYQPATNGQLSTKHQPASEKRPSTNEAFPSSKTANTGRKSKVAPQPKPPGTPPTTPPRLIVISACNVPSAQSLLTLAAEHCREDDTLALLDEQINVPPSQLPARGYATVSGEVLVKQAKLCKSNNRPIWFIFPGMGSQWHGMGSDLYTGDPVFHQSLDRCDRCLRRLGFKLRDLLLSHDPDIYKDAQHAFVGITSIQVCLVDMLAHYGIHPSGVVGHSLGELACGYADGCMSLEQTVRAAYWRGRVLKEANIPKGKMAATGMSWDEAIEVCRETNVTPACHNDVRSVTLSGRERDVDSLVQVLKDKGSIVNDVDSAGVAFHSPMLEPCRQPFLRALTKVIPHAKPRSERWISSSIPECEHGSSLASSSSAQYHVNNFLSPVLFYEAIQKIPPDALCVVVGPQGLFKSVVKRALGENCDVVIMMDRREEDNHVLCLQAVGKCYMAGADVRTACLHGAVHFPVSSTVPMLAPALCWDHTTSWHVPKETNTDASAGGVEKQLSLDSGHYLHDHRVNGQVIYPAAGLAICAWEALAKTNGVTPQQLPVTVTDLEIISATLLPTNGTVKLVTQLSVDGTFHITEGSKLVATGTVTESVHAIPQVEQGSNSREHATLSSGEIYQALRIRGYDYGPRFQHLQSFNVKSCEGVLSWGNNWITHIDGLLHALLIADGRSDFRIPVRIQRLQIQPTVDSINDTAAEIPCVVENSTGTVLSPYVSIEGMDDAVMAHKIPHRDPLCQKFYFQPYFPAKVTCVDDKPLDAGSCCISDNLRFCVYTAIENFSASRVGIVAVGPSTESIMDLNIKKIFDLEGGRADVTFLVSEDATDVSPDTYTKIKHDLDDSAVQQLLATTNICICLQETANKITATSKLLPEQSFILMLEDATSDSSSSAALLTDADKGFEVITSLRCQLMNMTLYRRKWQRRDGGKNVIVHVDEHEEFAWVEELKRALAKKVGLPDDRVWLFSQRDPSSGIIGLVKTLRMEAQGENVRCAFNMDDDPINLVDIQSKDLLMNVKKNGMMGRFCHTPTPFELPLVDSERRHVDVLSPGDVSTIVWMQTTEDHTLPTMTTRTSASVCFTGLGAQDFRTVIGQVASTERQVIGREFSGRDASDHAAMGIAKGTCLSTECTPTDLLWPVPSAWPLDAAATVPLAYTAAFHVVDTLGRLKPDQRTAVLVHGAETGSMGHALARLLLLHYGSTLLITAAADDDGDGRDKAFLHDELGLSEHQQLVVVQETMLRRNISEALTGQHVGLDLLVTLKTDDDALVTAASFLKPNGCIVQVNASNRPTRFRFKHLRSGVTVHTLDLGSFLDNQTTSGIARLKQLVAEGIASKAVCPLPKKVFAADELQEAFTALAGTQPQRKVVVKVTDEDERPGKGNAVCRTTFSPDKSYLVTGGLGGLGLELCLWMVRRGARMLVITSRSGVTTGYQRWLLERMERLGARVLVRIHDVCDSHQASALIGEMTRDLGPVGGLFHLAAVIVDSYFEKQTPATFEKVSRIKIDGLSNLDLITRKNCRTSLDWFVGFSSIAAGFGNAGQTNYAFANSSMERIIERRHEDGVPGESKAIQWGLMGDVGIVQRELGGNDYFVNGSVPQRVASYLRTVEVLLQTPGAVLASIVPMDTVARGGGAGDLIQKVMKVIGISDVGETEDDSSLIQLGADSLAINEIHQILGRDYHIPLTPAEVGEMTAGKLKQLSGV